MNTLRSWTFLLLPAALLLGACTSGGTIAAGGFLSDEDETGAVSDGFPAPSRRAVWETAMQMVRTHGYVPDPAVSRAEDARVQSRWRTSLHPFSGKGWRERVTVQVLPVPGREGYYRLDTNVLRQLNDNLSEPENPLTAEWAQGTRNTQVEQLINRRVELSFLPGDVSNEFRSKYDLPSREDPRYVEPPKKKEEKDDGPFPGLPFP